MMNNPFKLTKMNPYPIMLTLNMFSLMMNLMNFNLLMINICTLNTMMILIKWTKINLIINNSKSIINLNLTTNMKIIIMTETMFFMSFFYMHLSMKMFPPMEMNLMWPINMFMLNYYISLMNTFMLMNSSVTITMMMMNPKQKNMILTNILSIYFVMIQFYEYFNMKFTIINSTFWSIYFTMTLFHMIHVIIGITFINIILMNFKKKMNMNIQMLKMSIWYWHFIDMIWISIFMMFY